MRYLVLAFVATVGLFFVGSAQAADGCPGGRCLTLDLRVAQPVKAAVTVQRGARRAVVRAVTRVPLRPVKAIRSVRYCG